MSSVSHFLLRCVFTWLAFSPVLICAAQMGEHYPSSPVTMIVGWTAGGPADAVARMLSAELSKHLGQPVMVENRAGAGGNIGSVAAARARPDGYTIMLATVASHGLNSALYDNPGYDPIKDFAPIGLISTSPSTMLVPVDSPFQSVQDYVSHAKRHPGTLTYASGGIGSSQHLAGASFKVRTGIDQDARQAPSFRACRERG